MDVIPQRLPPQKAEPGFIMPNLGVLALTYSIRPITHNDAK